VPVFFVTVGFLVVLAFFEALAFDVVFFTDVFVVAVFTDFAVMSRRQGTETEARA
jgi:hypothetical protein